MSSRWFTTLGLATAALAASPFDGATWITPTAAVANGTFAAYRHVFDLNTTDCGKSSAVIAVDTKYWLYVNGELVIWEGGLKRGPTPTSGYYDRIDIPNRLLNFTGRNSIAVFALYLGTRTVRAAIHAQTYAHAHAHAHARARARPRTHTPLTLAPSDPVVADLAQQ
jgi:hypothetical protein